MTSLNLLSGETDDAKSNLNKIQKQINLIDKKIKENSKVKKGLNRSLKKHEKEISATKKVKARFVKVVAINTGVCPSWHAGNGGKAWLFCDEITVE